MISPDYDSKTFRTLMTEVLDGDIDDAGRQALNQILNSSAEARREYREMMDLHASLHLEYTGGGAAESMPGRSSNRPAKGHPTWHLGWAAAAAAAVALLAVLLPKTGETTSTASFATLQSAHSARWGSSDLATAEGTRLGTGTLRLEEGLAVILFDSGAEVSLEAPVELEIIDAMQCHIAHGTAVAQVPEQATGFRIGTPSAMVIDHGTRFSVCVDPDSGDTRTQVFEGLVELENPKSGDVVMLRTGQRASIEGHTTGPVKNGLDERFSSSTSEPLPGGPGWRLIKTFKDAYIGYHLESDSDELLYVKHGLDGFNRKAYLGFDLSGLNAAQIESARLLLQFEPTGLGLASHVPDATFAVYGFIEPNHPWNEITLNRHNAPANVLKTGAELVSEEVRKLGSFVVPQGVQRGRFGIDSDRLADYLREHAGSEVTLIIVRETAETANTGLVHGIASHRHPELPAPKLAIRLREG
jgi:ferric-dicitrate binding protein FerR (iron transport regulator)